jgi:hypothetical protein
MDLGSAILNLASSGFSWLNFELLEHEAHEMIPTLKEQIFCAGCEIMEECFTGGELSPNGLIAGVDKLQERMG